MEKRSTDRVNDKYIRVSSVTRDRVNEARKKYKFANADTLILFLLGDRKADIDEYIRNSEKEKTLVEIEAKIEKQVDRTHRRLGDYSKRYFEKIFDVKEAIELSTVTILKHLNTGVGQVVSTVGTDVKMTEEYLELKKKYDELLMRDDEEDDRNSIILAEKIRSISTYFVQEKGGFSTVFKAKLTEEQYNKFFR